MILGTRFFPLELLRPGGPSRPLLEQEWWLAAIQEPAAAFSPYPDRDWPTTTLPAFDAAWAAKNQGHAIGRSPEARAAVLEESRLECVDEACSGEVRELFERARAGV